jgi:hypothetical protein
MERQFDRGQKSGPIVLEHQLAVVQMRDRLGERESKAGALVRPA